MFTDIDVVLRRNYMISRFPEKKNPWDKPPKDFKKIDAFDAADAVLKIRRSLHLTHLTHLTQATQLTHLMHMNDLMTSINAAWKTFIPA